MQAASSLFRAHRHLGRLIHLLGVIAAFTGLPLRAQDETAESLRRQHAQLAPALARSDFGRPLLLQSRQTEGQTEGVVHAVLEAPLAHLAALVHAQRWCELLMLHPNTRSCQVAPGTNAPEIRLLFGSKSALMREGTGLALQLHATLAGPMLNVRLEAAQGPMGTRDYDIRMQAVALDPQRSFARFRYSYAYGLGARLAMQTYLSTWGHKKVGFSREEAPPGHEAPLVRGMRGVIERNTMRYFLAIETLLDTLDLPPEQHDQRLQRWFDATERYPRQLHELERQEYLALKRPQLGLPP